MNTTTTVYLTAIVCLVVYFVVSPKWRYIYLRRKHGCKEPARYAHRDTFFGLDLFFKTGRDYKQNRFLPELSKMFAENGHTFQTVEMGCRSLATDDPENVRSVLSSNASAWGVQQSRLAAMKPFCGRGLVTVDGDLWHRSRKLFQPSFAKDAVSDFSALEIFTQRMMTEIPANAASVDMQPLLSSLFINSTTLFLFGESFDAMSDTFTTINVSQTFDQAMFGSGIRVALGPLRFLARSSKWLKACKQTQMFAGFYVDKALRQRCGISPKTTANNKPKHVSLLNDLVQQTSDREHLRNEVLQAFFVSQGTTSNLVSNVLFLLARHPHIWTRLREEMLCVVSPSEPPTFDQIQKLTYLRKCVNETLRLLSILPQTSRVARCDTTLPVGGGPSGHAPIFVQAGTKVKLSLHTLHRRTDLWGDDADQFKPERWDNIDGLAHKFLPFGAGLRQCLGREMALAESSYVLIRLMQRFSDIRSTDDREWQGQVQITAQNLHGCHVAFS